MATHSSTLAWRIPRTEEPGRPQSMGLQESDTTWRLNHHQRSIKKAERRRMDALNCGVGEDS